MRRDALLLAKMIDLDIVHSTATDVLPGLVGQLRAVIANDGDERPEPAAGGTPQR